MTGVVVGIDAGGTKTRVVLADERGEAITSVVGAGAVAREGQIEASADTIAALVRDALASANMTHVSPKVLCVGIPGAGREPERQAMWQALVSRDVAEEVLVHADAMVALDDAFGDGAGVLLIAGTGSVAFARGPSGAFARCGGWGPVIGDEGSGAWLGRKALGVVAAASDGREPATALVGAVLTAAQVNEPSDLVGWAARAGQGELATLAPAVLGSAESGDVRADALVTMAAEELVLHVRALARQLFGDERAAVPVALMGGLLSRGSFLRKRVEQRLRSAVPGAQVRAKPVDPARGAIRGALRFLGLEVG